MLWMKCKKKMLNVQQIHSKKNIKHQQNVSIDIKVSIGNNSIGK